MKGDISSQVLGNDKGPHTKIDLLSNTSRQFMYEWIKLSICIKDQLIFLGSTIRIIMSYVICAAFAVVNSQLSVALLYSSCKRWKLSVQLEQNMSCSKSFCTLWVFFFSYANSIRPHKWKLHWLTSMLKLKVYKVTMYFRIQFLKKMQTLNILTR